MDNVFDITSTGDINISPEILMILEFKQIWDRDRTRSKDKAKKELTFIYGMCSRSNKNIWGDFKDPVTRGKVIKEDIFGKDSKWLPDVDVLKAIDKYNARRPQGPLEIVLDSVEGSMMKLAEYLQSVDFTETNANGGLVHDPKKVKDIISTMGKTVVDYNNLKREIEAGREAQDEKLRGGGSKGYFETVDVNDML